MLNYQGEIDAVRILLERSRRQDAVAHKVTLLPVVALGDG